MSAPYVTEFDLFQAMAGIALPASLKRTLAHCLFWMQHATHEKEGMPSIWKTGPELEERLSIAARTANTHLKRLACLGYWSLDYRPRPGTIGKVSWLTLTEKGGELIALAGTVNQPNSKRKKRSTGRTRIERSDVTDTHAKMSDSVTPRQTETTRETTKKTTSFFLSGKAKKEAFDFLREERGHRHPKPPRYASVSPAGELLARRIADLWESRGLRPWDWTSRFTWDYVDEVVRKFERYELVTEEAVHEFLLCMLENWSWMRHSMAPRYANHSSNLHAPSPMALGHECEEIVTLVRSKIEEASNPPKFSSMDEGF